MKSQRSISNKLQNNAKQNLILISKKIAHNILVIYMFVCDKGMAISQTKYGLFLACF